MKFEDWEPLYEEILDYFSFDRDADEEAARILADLLGPRRPSGPRDPMPRPLGNCLPIARFLPERYVANRGVSTRSTLGASSGPSS